jgi:hypothetical protein
MMRAGWKYPHQDIWTESCNPVMIKGTLGVTLVDGKRDGATRLRLVELGTS